MIEIMLSNWSFVAVALLLAVIGQYAKGMIFTKSNIVKYKEAGHWLGDVLYFGRQTLPLHPVIAGACVGLLGLPLSDTIMAMGTPSLATSVVYFAAAGICSTWIYDTLKSLKKKYAGSNE